MKRIKQFLKLITKPDLACFKLFIIGALTCFIFAPYYFFALGFICYSYLAYRIYFIKNLRSAYQQIFYFFLGFYLSNFYWISFSFLVNADFKLLFPLAFIIIPLYLALFSAAFFLLLSYIRQKYQLSKLGFYYLFCLCLIMHELLRANFVPLIDLKGLPWNLLGYSYFTNLNLAQIADFIGVNGLTILAGFLFPLFFLLFTLELKATVIIAIIFSIITAGQHLYGSKKLATYSDNNSSLQANLKLLHLNNKTHISADPELVLANLDEAIAILNADLAANKDDILILPEGLISVLGTSDYNEAIEYILASLERPYAYLIIGAPRAEQNSYYYNFYNSLFVIDSQGNYLNYYDKVNLVPFGEYNPYLNIIPSLATNAGFSKGLEQNKIIELANVKFVPLICYDAIFSGKFSATGDLLLNITNDIWFTRKIYGKNISLGPWQHLDHTRMRAIEEGKPLIRVANYGISAVIDSVGQISKQQGFYDAESLLSAKLPAKLEQQTIFNQYRDLFTQIFILLNFLCFFCFLSGIRT